MGRRARTIFYPILLLVGLLGAGDFLDDWPNPSLGRASGWLDLDDPDATRPHTSGVAPETSVALTLPEMPKAERGVSGWLLPSSGLRCPEPATISPRIPRAPPAA